jgi:uncharacterized membrane protein YoaK (UPF0700 family)
VFLATRIVKPTRGSGLWPRRVTLALCVAALAEAAFLVGWLAAAGEPSQAVGDVLIALSALAFGIQSAAVMSLDVKGVFTTAATATVIMLMGGEAGRRRANVERRRLTAIIAGLFAGAAAGTLLVLHARVYAPLVPLAATLAAVSAASFALSE